MIPGRVFGKPRASEIPFVFRKTGTVDGGLMLANAIPGFSAPM
jgi:hypothetical protein